MTMEEQERRILDGRQKSLPAVCKSREQKIALGWAGCLPPLHVYTVSEVYTQTCLDLLHRSCKSTVEKMNGLD